MDIVTGKGGRGQTDKHKIVLLLFAKNIVIFVDTEPINLCQEHKAR